MMCFMVIIVLMNLMSGFQPGSKVDNWGHLEGLFTGLVCGFAFLKPMES